MKKKLQNSATTKDYLSKLPKYYAICLWARYGILEVASEGKCTKDGIPLVWKYHDLNGELDEYILIPITHITSGGVYCWTTSKEAAEKIAESMNK